MGEKNFDELDQDEDLVEINLPPMFMSEEERISYEAEIFGRRALDKLYELGYQWDGQDWILPEPTTDEGMLDER
jgi:hypothetical protein